MEFLDRHRFKEFKLNEITAYLKNLGAEHDSGKKLKGKFMNVPGLLKTLKCKRRIYTTRNRKGGL